MLFKWTIVCLFYQRMTTCLRYLKLFQPFIPTPSVEKNQNKLIHIQHLRSISPFLRFLVKPYLPFYAFRLPRNKTSDRSNCLPRPERCKGKKNEIKKEKRKERQNGSWMKKTFAQRKETRGTEWSWVGTRSGSTWTCDSFFSRVPKVSLSISISSYSPFFFQAIQRGLLLLILLFFAGDTP